jgi:hypothetical protein
MDRVAGAPRLYPATYVAVPTIANVRRQIETPPVRNIAGRLAVGMEGTREIRPWLNPRTRTSRLGMQGLIGQAALPASESRQGRNPREDGTRRMPRTPPWGFG